MHNDDDLARRLIDAQLELGKRAKEKGKKIESMTLKQYTDGAHQKFKNEIALMNIERDALKMPVVTKAVFARLGGHLRMVAAPDQ